MKGKNKEEIQKKKRLSGFKKFLLAYVVIFLIFATVLLTLLYDLLKDYEAGEPNNVMEEFVKSFNDDTIEEILETQDFHLTEFESVEVLKEYYTAQIRGKTLSYKRKSGEFTTETPVYSLMAGEEQIARVTLKEKRKNSHNFTEWEIGSITLTDIADEEKKEVTIHAPAQVKIYINGVEVSDTYKSGEDTVNKNTKNLAGLTGVLYDRTYVIQGLINEPEITAVLGENPLSVSMSEEGYTVPYPTDEKLLSEQKSRITEIFESYGRYIINRGNLDTLLSYTRGQAHIYLQDIPAVWAYLYGREYTYEFRNESVTNLVKYSENCFAADVYFDLYVDYGIGNTTYNTSMTYIMIKENGSWYLADFIQHQTESEEK